MMIALSNGAIGNSAFYKGQKMDVVELVTALRKQRYKLGTEARLQASVTENLEALIGADRFKAEAQIGRGERIDFLVNGGIGIECKLKCSRRAIYRQLTRYSECKSINALILITATATGLPETLGDCPLYYVSLGRASL